MSKKLFMWPLETGGGGAAAPPAPPEPSPAPLKREVEEKASTAARAERLRRLLARGRASTVKTWMSPEGELRVKMGG